MNVALHKINVLWGESLYIETLTIFIVGIFFVRTLQLKNFNHFRDCYLIYQASCLVLFISCPIIFILNDVPHSIKFIEVMNTWFNCVETFVIFKYFKILEFSSHTVKLLRYSAWLLIIAFAILGLNIISINDNSLTLKHARVINKFSEITDVVKRLIFLVPCLLYFHRVFNLNRVLIFKQVLVVFAIFCYSVFGVFAYSLGANISYYSLSKKIIQATPDIFLLLLCYSMFSFVKQNIILSTSNDSIFTKSSESQ